MDNTDQLIEDLSKDLKPVRPVSLKQALVIWSVIALAIGTYYLRSVGMRSDVLVKITSFDYILGLLFYVEIFFLASWVTMRLVVPGREPKSLWKHTTVLALSACAAVMFYAGVEQWTWASLSQFDGFAALGCCLRISIGALLPASVMLAISQIYAPMRPKASAGYLWLSAATLVSIVSQLNCPINTLNHIMVGHGILLLATGAVGWLFFWMISYLMNKVTLRVRLKGIDSSRYKTVSRS